MSEEEIKLDDRLAVRIDKKTKEEFSKKTKANKSNPSEIVLKWIREYLSQETRVETDVITVTTKVEKLEQRVMALEEKLITSLEENDSLRQWRDLVVKSLPKENPSDTQ